MTEHENNLLDEWGLLDTTTPQEIIPLSLQVSDTFTKSEIINFAKIKAEELCANNNPLEVYAHFERAELLASELKKAAKDSVEAIVYQNKESQSVNGVEFAQAQVATKYEYSTCNDIYYNEICQEIEALLAIKAEKEKFLKMLPKEGAEIVHPITSETYRIEQPIKTGKASFKATIK